MQPSRSEIHSFLAEYSGATGQVQSGRFRRDQLRLDFNGSTSVVVRLRDLRTSCCMIDLDSSIFTLDFTDVIGANYPDASEAGPSLPVLTVRVGCLARDMNARIARTPRRRRTVSESDDLQHNEPLNPPGGSTRLPEFLDPTPAPAARAPAAKAQARTKQDAERQSLQDIEEMLNELWKEPTTGK